MSDRWWMRGAVALLAGATVWATACDGTLPGGDDDDSAIGDDDDATPSTFTPEGVTITTEDGLELSATWRRADGVTSEGPALLLLHQYERDRADFDLVFAGFREAGISTLALDFRGHGLSDDAPVPLPDLLSDPDQLRLDVEAALAWIHDRPEVDGDRVGVLGVSVGANLAVVANHNREAWGVRTTASISARRSAVDTLAGTSVLDLQRALYAAGDGEVPQAADAEVLAAITVEPNEVRLVEGTDRHGADLFLFSSGVRDGVVFWFSTHL
jgi:dienelactone hydrolase